MVDYHLHTRLCRHAEGEMSQYIENAIEAGIDEIAFTDHIPLPDQYDSAHRMSLAEFETYLDWIESARSTYKEIKIRTGIEADYLPQYEKFLDDFLRQYRFDMVLMSVHFINHWQDGNWVFNYSFPGREEKDIFRDYTEALISGIRTGLFDIVAHIDLLKRQGVSLIQEYPDLADSILDEIKNQDMVVEINTSGFRKAVAESYPGRDWFPALITKKIDICTGSDAHKPEQVGFNFGQTYRDLADHGFTVITSFENRSKQYRKIL